MVIIAFSSWPPESAKAILERYVKVPPAPGFIKMEGPYMYSEGEKGLHAATLYKFDKTKAAEAIKLVNDQHAVFWGVPGFSFDIKVCANAIRATELSGGA